jgi:hypothetical protein
MLDGRLCLVFVGDVRPQTAPPRPLLVRPDGMRHGSEPLTVDGPEGVDRESQHALLLFVRPELPMFSHRHAEDAVSFLSVTGHKSTPY